MDSGRDRCHFFNAPQGCRNGARCRFIHDNNARPVVPTCRFYRLPKGRRHGDHCMPHKSHRKDSANPNNQKRADVLQQLEDLSLKESNDSIKQSRPILDAPDFDPNEFSLDPEVAYLAFNGQVKYDSSAIGRTKWKHGTLMLIREENSWALGLHFDYVDDRDDFKPVLTMEKFEHSMLKRVVCKLSGVTIYCLYEGADCIIDYRPSGADNTQGIYAVFAEIIHLDNGGVAKLNKKGSRVVKIIKNDDGDEDRDEDEVDDDDDDDDEEDDDEGDEKADNDEDSNDDEDEDSDDDKNDHEDNYKRDVQEEEESDADDDSIDDCFEKQIIGRFERWKAEVCLKEGAKEVTKMTTVQCGVCSEDFTGKKPFEKLKDHYYDKLLNKDFKHSFFKVGCHELQKSTECILCGRHFGHCGSLIQHMFDKSRCSDIEGDQHRVDGHKVGCRTCLLSRRSP